jgi:hypothetical protein
MICLSLNQANLSMQSNSNRSVIHYSNTHDDSSGTAKQNYSSFNTFLPLLHFFIQLYFVFVVKWTSISTIYNLLLKMLLKASKRRENLRIKSIQLQNNHISFIIHTDVFLLSGVTTYKNYFMLILLYGSSTT